jgi:hypothetical protein
MDKRKILTKELVVGIISHYELCIKKVKSMNDITKIISYVEKMSVDAGICWCSHTVFGVYICNDEWVNSFSSHMQFWFDCPEYSKTKSEVISLLEQRVDRLKTFKD